MATRAVATGLRFPEGPIKTLARECDRTGVFHAQPDGSQITEANFSLEGAPTAALPLNFLVG